MYQNKDNTILFRDSITNVAFIRAYMYKNDYKDNDEGFYQARSDIRALSNDEFYEVYKLYWLKNLMDLKKRKLIKK